MASDARLPPERSASEESALQSSGGFSLLPPSPSKASPAAPPTSSELQAILKPRAASFSAPSASGPLLSQHLAAVAQQAAGGVPTTAPAASPPSTQQSSQRDHGVPSDWSGLLDEHRLLVHLHLAQLREERLWRGGNLQAEICNDFQKVVLWLLKRENIFHFSQTTFNLALTILNRLLVSVKIKKRLLQVITITSLRLAVKMNEEEELIPRIKDFIKHYGFGYTPNELLRMELAILDRLYWDLHTGTPLEFLTIFHSLVVLSRPHVVELLPQRNPSLHVASLTRQLQHCMAGHQLLQFKGSTLALVIITLELERLMPDWWTPISDLLKKAQVICTEQYSCCKELVKQHLGSLNQPPA
uniref:Cyclin I family member 2 n=1 Tax=Ictidomys tridecemlineatus TaxID=43179 RepID=I3LYD4_ICTTR